MRLLQLVTNSYAATSFVEDSNTIGTNFIVTDDNTTFDNFSVTVVPEPSSAVLLSVVGMLGLMRRRR